MSTRHDRIRNSLSFANVTAVSAFVIALGGTSHVAISLPKNSVGSPQIKFGAVGQSDLHAHAVTTGKVENHSLLARDFAEGEIPTGPVGPSGVSGYEIVRLRERREMSSGAGVTGLNVRCPAGKVPAARTQPGTSVRARSTSW